MITRYSPTTSGSSNHESDARSEERAEVAGDNGWWDVTAHDFQQTWATLLAVPPVR